MSAAVVLVVARDPLLRSTVRHALEAERHTVLEAEDTPAALSSAAHRAPDLVLQDLSVPTGEAQELATRLRQLPYHDDVPILGLAHSAPTDDDALALAAVGISDILINPEDADQVRRQVRAYLPEGFREPPPRPAPPPSWETTVTLRVLRDLPGALASVEEDAAGALAQALRTLADSSLATACAIYEQHPDGTLHVRASRGCPGAASACFQDFLGQPQLLVELTGSPTPTALPQDLPHTAGALLRRAGLRSALVVPLRTPRNAVLGVLFLGSADQDLGRPALRGLGVAVGYQMVAALNRDRAARELQQRQGQHAQQARELDSVLESIVDGVVVVDANGQVRTCNRAAQRVTRLEGERWPSHADALLRHAYLADQATPCPRARFPFTRALAGETVADEVLFLRHAAALDGIWLRVRAQPLRDAAGLPAGCVAVLHDITPEKATQDALERARRDFRQVIEAAPDAMVIRRGPDLVYVNPSFATCLGYARTEDLLGRAFVDLVHPDDRERAQAFQDGSAAPSTHAEFRLRRADGTAVTLELSAHQPVQFEGEHAHLVIGRDLSERKKMQAQLLVSDRMASVGMLAAGVAHEINNPLASVMVNLDLAVMDAQTLDRKVGRFEGLGALADELRDAREGAERVRQIVRDLRIFSRAEEDKLGPVEVQRVLESSLRMAWNEIRHRARLVKDYGQVPLVEANESRLGQVFLNLIVNAAQAIPEGQADRHEIRVTTRTDAQGRTAIEVRDTGVGMPPEVIKQLFVPFFTTKPAGVGTGLGLSICHRIVTGLGGEITVESTPGVGTSFRVLLPPACSDAAEVGGGSAPVPGARRARVLVVDDEKSIGTAVRRIFAPDHDVVTLTSGTDALEHIRGGERFDVILCDLMMPVMTGMDFYGELVRLDPAQARAVVFLTGGAFTPKARTFLEQVTNPRLEKPFDVQNLRALVNERLR